MPLSSNAPLPRLTALGEVEEGALRFRLQTLKRLVVVESLPLILALAHRLPSLLAHPPQEPRRQAVEKTLALGLTAILQLVKALGIHPSLHLPLVYRLQRSPPLLAERNQLPRPAKLRPILQFPFQTPLLDERIQTVPATHFLPHQLARAVNLTRLVFLAHLPVRTRMIVEEALQELGAPRRFLSLPVLQTTQEQVERKDLLQRHQVPLKIRDPVVLLDRRALVIRVEMARHPPFAPVRMGTDVATLQAQAEALLA